MSERPILFSGPMVRAILDGRKTQTRRVVTPRPPDCELIGPELYAPVVIDRHGEEQPGAEVFGVYDELGEYDCRCPFGRPGDRLWVRETWAAVECERGDTGAFWGPDRNWFIEDKRHDEQWMQLVYATDASYCPGQYGMAKLPDGAMFEGPWRPSIHMPRWASRITLEVTGVRVERLQGISDEDAEAEGVLAEMHCDIAAGATMTCEVPSPKRMFCRLWDSIYAKRAPWRSNPWVWVVDFRRVESWLMSLYPLIRQAVRESAAKGLEPDSVWPVEISIPLQRKVVKP